MFLQGKLYFTVRHCSKDLITCLNPHFTDVETDPQGTSVASQVTQLVRPGWGWGQDVNPMVWLWSPSSWPPCCTASQGLRSPRRGTTDRLWHAGTTLMLFPTPPGLLMKLHNCHINTGTMSLILVACLELCPEIYVPHIH